MNSYVSYAEIQGVIVSQPELLDNSESFKLAAFVLRKPILTAELIEQFKECQRRPFR